MSKKIKRDKSFLKSDLKNIKFAKSMQIPATILLAAGISLSAIFATLTTKNVVDFAIHNFEEKSYSSQIADYDQNSNKVSELKSKQSEIVKKEYDDLVCFTLNGLMLAFFLSMAALDGKYRKEYAEYSNHLKVTLLEDFKTEILNENNYSLSNDITNIMFQKDPNGSRKAEFEKLPINERYHKLNEFINTLLKSEVPSLYKQSPIIMSYFQEFMKDYEQKHQKKFAELDEQTQIKLVINFLQNGIKNEYFLTSSNDFSYYIGK